MRAAQHFSEKAPIARKRREDCTADEHSLVLEPTLLCWLAGLCCGLVDKHSDSAETGMSVPRVPLVVGNAVINFENLQTVQVVLREEEAK